MRFQRREIVESHPRTALARLTKMPAGCGIDADLVHPERKRLAEQLMIVAWPATTISYDENGVRRRPSHATA